jgi:hypothetical protein
MPVSAALFLLSGCGVYTFSGSTLPSHLKTVEIPLFINNSLQPGVAESVTDLLNQRVQSTNLMKPVAGNGDAVIRGKVLSYVNQPYTYGSETRRDVTVSSYTVRISVEIEFFDTVKDKAIYKGVITEEGVYDFPAQMEQEGKKKAIDKIIDRIMENSVQSW